MFDQSIIFSFFIIFTGAGILATLALYLRQPIFIAYIFLGALLGPYGMAWIKDTQLLVDISHAGIIFLLFLIGLDMQPSHLFSMLKKGTGIALISSLLFASAGFSIAWGFGFSYIDSVIVGAATMFSSTIIGIKLLPTTVLHHKKTGEWVVGMLLLQDLIAIGLLILITAHGEGQQGSIADIGSLLRLIGLPLWLLACFVIVRWCVLPLITRFDRFHEYIFLIAIGWCLACAETATMLGFSAEIGAFIGGVSLATSPISQYIAIHLKPIRDFFLVVFFFSVGAGFNTALLGNIWLAATVLAAAVLLIKPVVFKYLFKLFSDDNAMRWEVGFRLGQTSEFSILVATMALSSQLITESAATLIQTTAIITFIISSYTVVWFFKSPIAIKDHLRHD